MKWIVISGERKTQSKRRISWELLKLEKNFGENSNLENSLSRIVGRKILDLKKIYTKFGKTSEFKNDSKKF